MRVLIVEDDYSLRELTSLQIQEYLKFEVATLDTAEKAIEITEMGEIFDIYIIDYKLPGMDGLMLASWLRGYEIDAQIIMNTVSHDIELVKKAESLDVAYFITKSGHSEELLKAVEIALERKNKGTVFLQTAMDGAHKLMGSYRQKNGSVKIYEAAGLREGELCICSQTGCINGCAFCITSELNKEVKNFSVVEMQNQIFQAETFQRVGRDTPRCVNIEGMGDPIYNLDNVEELMRRYDERYTFRISTIGIVSRLDKLRRFIGNPKMEQIQFSIHWAIDEERAKHILVAGKKNPVRAIFAFAKEYGALSGTLVAMNCTLMEGKNDNPYQIEAMADLFDEFDGGGKKDLFLRLSLFNSYSDSSYEPSSKRELVKEILKKRGIFFKEFTSVGRGLAGCGELGAERVRLVKR